MKKTIATIAVALSLGVSCSRPVIIETGLATTTTTTAVPVEKCLDQFDEAMNIVIERYEEDEGDLGFDWDTQSKLARSIFLQAGPLLDVFLPLLRVGNDGHCASIIEDTYGQSCDLF